MRSTALIAAVVGGLMASSSFGALQVYLGTNNLDISPAALPGQNSTPGTTTGGAPAGSQVYLITVKDDASPTTLINAASLTGVATTGKFYFPFGDSAGGVGGTASAANISKRNNPDGTFFFLPAQTGGVASNADTVAGTFPDQNENDGSRNFSIVSFRGDGSPYSTTAAIGLVLGAVVVPQGTLFTISGVVNSTLDSVNSVPFTFSNNIPEPTTLSAMGLAALGLVRRRK